MTLGAVGCGSEQSPSWLWEQLVVALSGVRHGSGSTPSGWDDASSSRSHDRGVSGCPQIMSANKGVQTPLYLCQPMSAFSRPPLPTSSGNVSICPTSIFLTPST